MIATGELGEDLQRDKNPLANPPKFQLAICDQIFDCADAERQHLSSFPLVKHQLCLSRGVFPLTNISIHVLSSGSSQLI
jgi:hypothetical protein